MLKQWSLRLQQGHHTILFPKEAPQLLALYRGLPKIDASKCPDGCRECVDTCPTEAISIISGGPRLDLGLCLFCSECVQACPTSGISYTRDFRMAARRREDLIIDDKGMKLAEALEKKSRALFGRSLKLRQVSAGGCNGYEVELNVLNTVVFDLGRFGIQIVASPVTPMALSLPALSRKTWLLPCVRPMTPSRHPSWSSPSAAAPSLADPSAASPKSKTARTRCCLLTYTYPAVRLIL